MHIDAMHLSLYVEVRYEPSEPYLWGRDFALTCHRVGAYLLIKVGT